MKRQEQIEKAATAKSRGETPYYYDAFVEGAEWADAHPHWISVDDELPKVGVAVLTTTQNGTQRVGCYEDGWWLANSPDLVRMGSITHWMRLPAEPKKGGAQ